MESTAATQPAGQTKVCATFLVLGALFGACYAVILPPLQAPDEFAHFYRAYNVSGGSCVAPLLTPIPKTVEELAAGFQPHVETRRRISVYYILRFMSMPLAERKQDGVRNEAANMYSCVPYIPAALGIGAGRLFGLSPGALLYLGRFANLIAYLGIVTLALRQLPGFHIPMLCLALMPMALNQAASASWDGVAFSTAFFLCAYIMKLAWDPAVSILQPRHYWTLGVAIVLASLCKTDAWLVPLLFFVPAAKFSNSRRKWMVVLAFAVLSLAVVSGWNYLNRQDMATWVEGIKVRHIQLSDNAAFITEHPALFIQAFVRTVRANWGIYMAQFVGRLGWLVVILPTWIIWMYVILLGFVALTDDAAIRLKTGHRLVCLGIAAIATASIFIGMWCAETPLDYKDIVLHGSGHVPGVQGRYFIPFAFPLLLVISSSRLRVEKDMVTGPGSGYDHDGKRRRCGGDREPVLHHRGRRNGLRQEAGETVRDDAGGY